MASYKKTFRHTLAAKKELSMVTKQLSDKDNTAHELYSLKHDVRHLDRLIGGQTKKPEQVQQRLIDFISKNKFNVNIVGIEDVHLFADDDFLIHSNQIELEGAYKDLVKTLYDIEKYFKYSRVASTRLYSKKNYRNNTKMLFLKIIFQNYENNK
ncbi:hypothetical protein [Seonamhaeicola aphaedonensis]|nr:hypothetical protein [Seonamhaeicola aphaedonensis]